MDRYFFHPGGKKITEEAGKLARLAAGDRVLDVGCGLGAAAAFLRERFGAEIWGLDRSETALARAGEWFPGPEYVLGDAADLPWPDAFFDAVIMECSLSQMEDPAAALSESARVLKEGGRLVIATLSGMEGPPPIASDGRISLPGLEDALLSLGFSGLRFLDRTGELGQFAADAIFQSGSLAAWQKAAAELLGAEAFPCGVRRSGLGYHLVTGRKRPGLALWREMRLRGDFTTEWDLRSEPERLLRVPGREVARIITHSTSGSTGEPKRIYFTEEDMLATADFFTWGMEPMVSPGGRTAVFMDGPARFSVGGLLAVALERLGAEISVCGFITDYARAAEAARGAECLVGLPGQMAALAEAAPDLRPQAVLLSGDYIPESVEERLRRVWGCRMYTHWGMTETGYGGGVDCPRCRGSHLREDLLVEIVDPETGEPLPRGELGEIVISTTERKAMPLYRYRTGDLGRLMPGVCDCGRPEPRLDRVRRRRGDEVPVKGGSLSIHALDECLFSVPGVMDFRGMLTGNDRLLVIWDGTASEEDVETALRRRWPGLTITTKKAPLSPDREKRRLERREEKR